MTDILDTPEGKRAWKQLVHTWVKAPHALERGCGRDTLVHWVSQSRTFPSRGGFTCRLYPAVTYRRVLLAAVARGWATALPPSPSGHSRFKLLR
jgi:hypothetical protein